MESSEPDPQLDELAEAAGNTFDSVREQVVRGRLAARLFGREVQAPRFGRFELRTPLGEGGMGTVYSAWDPVLEREVALKVIDTERLGPALAERALREARSLAKLAHPNVVSVFEAGEVEARVWIAMELLTGSTLRQWQDSDANPSQVQRLDKWLAVGRGLMAVHAAGLVHRDVKPNNVVIGDDGRPRLIDFGLVRARGAAEPSETGEGAGISSVQTQGFVGTRAYAAPEQRAGGLADARADQYSLCVSVWESLCGERPPEPSERDGRPLEWPRGVSVPGGVTRALRRGLAVEPSERHADLEPLVNALESAVGGHSRRLTLMLGTAAASVLVTSIALTGDAAEPADPCAKDERALEGTWDDARRARLREHLDASTRAFVSRTTQQLEQALDRWSADWHEARRAACSATRIEGVQSEATLDLRNGCLEHKRRVVTTLLDAMVDTNLQLDAAAHAPELLRELPRLEACGDPQRLAEVEPLPPPGAQREAILAAYDGATRVRALTSVGDVRRAEQHLERLTQEADALGHAPLEIEVDALSGWVDLRCDRRSRATETLVKAARAAEAHRLDDLAATIWTDAAEAAAGHWSKPELEQWIVDEADVALRRLGRPRDAREVSLLSARATYDAREGHLDQALEGYRAALQLARAVGDREAQNAQRHLVGSTLGLLGRVDEAREVYEAVHRDTVDLWGPGSPRVASCEFNLAVLAVEAGQVERADAHFDRAEAFYVSALGEESVSLAHVRFGRAKLAMLRGEFDTALTMIESALEVYERELGADHERLAEVHEGRGVLRYFTGALEASIESYEAAVKLLERYPESPDLARLHSNIGESELALGRLEAAADRFTQALSIYANAVPNDHPDLALPLKGRGQVSLALGRPRLAAEDLKRALALLERDQAEPLELADTSFSLARALVEGPGDAGARARALELAKRAARSYAQLGVEDRVRDVEAWTSTTGPR